MRWVRPVSTNGRDDANEERDGKERGKEGAE